MKKMTLKSVVGFEPSWLRTRVSTRAQASLRFLPLLNKPTQKTTPSNMHDPKIQYNLKTSLSLPCKWSKNKKYKVQKGIQEFIIIWENMMWQQRNACEGWYMCNTEVSNIIWLRRGLSHHLWEKGNKEENGRMQREKRKIN